MLAFPSSKKSRWWVLAAFAGLLLALFAIVGVSEGIGDPSIPSGDVALVENAPGDIGKVTQEEFDHAVLLASKQQGLDKVPKAGESEYEDLKDNALNLLLEGIWISGLAAEEGVAVSDEEVAQGRKEAEKSFQSKKEFKNFLKESGFTSADVDDRVTVQILSSKLQELIQKRAPTPSHAEIEAYYEAAKDTQYRRNATRDIRWVVNQEREKAEKALARLRKSNGVKDWDRVAKEFSEDAATTQRGGLQTVNEDTLEEPLTKAVFGAPEDRLEGLVKTMRGFVVFEVVDSKPEGFQELAEVKSGIESTLGQRLAQEYFDNFANLFSVTWTARTHCAEGFVSERCADYKSSGHPATAPEGCYEADPEGGRPEACPAPVFQLIPALPGTVSPLEPKGKPLAQRPQPAESPASGESASGAPLPSP